MLQVRILRPISGLAATVGDVVDASEWVTLRELERQGFVERLATLTPSPTRKGETRNVHDSHA